MAHATLPDDPNQVRMSIGEHLDELRGRLIRALLALVVAAVACIYPARWLFEILAAPVVRTLIRYGQPPTFLQTSPLETFLIYVKVVVIAGLVIASPYVLYQLWMFVAAGLYRREREWVYRLVWPSAALFVVGVVFMYYIVLPLSLNFLIGFGNFLPMPDTRASGFEALILGDKSTHPAATQPATGGGAVIPQYASDPPDPPPGFIWFNASRNELKLRTADETFSTRLDRDAQRSLVTTHFRIAEYLGFVLMLTIAFGLAFQIPLVVVFLAGSGLVPVASMRKLRKVVILVIVVIAGMLAPPDILSHLLLSGPMILLFEIGLLVAARRGASRGAAT